MNAEYEKKGWRPTGRGWSTNDGWSVYQEASGGYWYASHWGRPLHTSGKRPRRAWWRLLARALRTVEGKREAEQQAGASRSEP